MCKSILKGIGRATEIGKTSILPLIATIATGGDPIAMALAGAASSAGTGSSFGSSLLNGLVSGLTAGAANGQGVGSLLGGNNTMVGRLLNSGQSSFADSGLGQFLGAKAPITGSTIASVGSDSSPGLLDRLSSSLGLSDSTPSAATSGNLMAGDALANSGYLNTPGSSNFLSTPSYQAFMGGSTSPSSLMTSGNLMAGGALSNPALTSTISSAGSSGSSGGGILSNLLNNIENNPLKALAAAAPLAEKLMGNPVAGGITGAQTQAQLAAQQAKDAAYSQSVEAAMNAGPGVFTQAPRSKQDYYNYAYQSGNTPLVTYAAPNGINTTGASVPQLADGGKFTPMAVTRSQAPSRANTNLPMSSQPSAVVDVDGDKPTYAMGGMHFNPAMMHHPMSGAGPFAAMPAHQMMNPAPPPHAMIAARARHQLPMHNMPLFQGTPIHPPSSAMPSMMQGNMSQDPNTQMPDQGIPASAGMGGFAKGGQYWAPFANAHFASGGYADPEEGDKAMAMGMIPSYSPEEMQQQEAQAQQDAQSRALMQILLGNSGPTKKPGKAKGGTLMDKPSVTQMNAGRMYKGPGGGQDDKLDVGNAKLSPNEYVVQADVVSALGDGNPDEGAKKLDAMGQKVRKHKAKGKSSPKAGSPETYVKKGKK